MFILKYSILINLIEFLNAQRQFSLTFSAKHKNGITKALRSIRFTWKRVNYCIHTIVVDTYCNCWYNLNKNHSYCLVIYEVFEPYRCTLDKIVVVCCCYNRAVFRRLFCWNVLIFFLCYLLDTTSFYVS